MPGVCTRMMCTNFRTVVLATQDKNESTAFSQAGFKGDLSVVGFDDGFRNSQAQASPLMFPGRRHIDLSKGAVNFFDLAFGNADARV